MKNESKWLEWCVFRAQGVLNPMGLVSSLYDKQFLKNQTFRGKVVQNGVKKHKNGMGPM